MKIRYVFCNEEVEIEVSEELGAIILEMDREEYNNDHTETRRHCSIDALNLNHTYLHSEVDPETALLEKEARTELYDALRQLSPNQRGLIRQLYVERLPYANIAAVKSVDESAVRHAAKRALKKIKKFLN